MRTKFFLGALVVVAGLFISCEKDKDENEANILSGLKDNQVSWNGKVADIKATAGPNNFDWECESLGIAQVMDLDGDATNGTVLDLAKLTSKNGFRISMMDGGGLGFHLEAMNHGEEKFTGYSLGGEDSDFIEGKSCFKEGTFKGKYDENAGTFRLEYSGTLINGNKIAVKGFVQIQRK